MRGQRSRNSVVVALAGDQQKRLPAELYGIWAAHWYPDGETWRVTHAPSGRAVYRDMSAHDARIVALLLAERVPVFEYEWTEGRPPKNHEVWDWFYIVEATLGEVLGA